MTRSESKMYKKEFNEEFKTLSEKIEKEKGNFRGINSEVWSALQRVEKDIKEFIRRLFEDIPKECSFIPREGKCGVVSVHDIIKERAGGDLVK